jgi:hypothetical protein
MTTIKLPCYGIVIEYENGGGNITSQLHESVEVDVTRDDDEVARDELYDAAMDAVESMVLAHAIAGIDVSSPAYLEGIETAVQACSNNI